jgi:hypothetical protein
MRTIAVADGSIIFGGCKGTLADRGWREGPLVAVELCRDIRGGIAGHRHIGGQRGDGVRDKRLVGGRVTAIKTQTDLLTVSGSDLQVPAVIRSADVEACEERRGPCELSVRREFVVRAVEFRQGIVKREHVDTEAVRHVFDDRVRRIRRHRHIVIVDACGNGSLRDRQFPKPGADGGKHAILGRARAAVEHSAREEALWGAADIDERHV